LAGRSDRAAAAAVLGCRARVVVMLTATPHSGDEEEFSRLSAVGDIRHQFPLMTFRRARADVGLPRNRRSTVLRVRPTSDETVMHDALSDYLRRLIDEPSARSAGMSLLSSILLRRACSSPAALVRSIQRRMSLLFDNAVALREQLTLPFAGTDSDDEPGFELGVAGLRDGDEEFRRLQRLTELAGAAAACESKLQVLRRLLRRIDEPAIVFTEYRDTLQHMCAGLHDCDPLTLHGGLTSRERADVIRRFNEGRSSLLLATDAASEGLNLHHRCRFVVNLEIPWTPLRLEQRVGRVDRIGQTRRVHALNLVASGTYDEVMARQLGERALRIEAALDQPIRDGQRLRVSELETARLLMAKTLSPSLQRPSSMAPLLTSVTRTHHTAGQVSAFQLSFEDRSGRPVFDTIAGVRTSTQFADLELQESVARHHERVLASVAGEIGPWLELFRRREEAIVHALRDSHARLSAGLLQPGLFDRRAERAAAAQAARVDEATVNSRARLDGLERLRGLRCGERRLLFEIRFRP
jgi:hypothetical protein